MKRIVLGSEFRSELIQMRRDEFRPRFLIALGLFAASFTVFSMFETPQTALEIAARITSISSLFLFTVGVKNLFVLWNNEEAVFKDFLKGSRAMISCDQCSGRSRKVIWYPERSVLLSSTLVTKGNSIYKKRTQNTFEKIFHYSSDGEIAGYTEVPENYKYYVEAWTEDWDLEYKCPNCSYVLAIRVRDYLESGKCIDFLEITKT